MALSDFDLVLFGGGGDLAMRKLLPALYARHRAKDLPATARLVCVGRHAWSTAQFLESVNTSAKPHITEACFETTLWESFCQRITYVAIDADDLATYPALTAALRKDPGLTRVFYLATPPGLFAHICQNLAAAGLANDQSRVVLEKPLGRDLASAKQINRDVGEVFTESQIFRIDPTLQQAQHHQLHIRSHVDFSVGNRGYVEVSRRPQRVPCARFFGIVQAVG